jgi:hypothetical protein
MARGNLPPTRRAFWTHGVLLSYGGLHLCLEDRSFCLALASPAPEIAEPFHADAARRAGDVARVTGIIGGAPDASARGTGGPDAAARAGSRDGAPEPRQAADSPAPLPGPDLFFWAFESGPGLAARGGAGSSLEDLITSPERYEGRTVTVQGLFRGANLFQDLPGAGRRRASDWVLRDGPFSIWVGGRPPRGEGWSLDPTSRSDTTWRVEVEGRVVRRGPVVSIEARRVQLLDRTAPEP